MQLTKFVNRKLHLNKFFYLQRLLSGERAIL